MRTRFTWSSVVLGIWGWYEWLLMLLLSSLLLLFDIPEWYRIPNKSFQPKLIDPGNWMEREDLIHSNEHSTSVTFLALCYNYFKYKTVVLPNLDLSIWGKRRETFNLYICGCVYFVVQSNRKTEKKAQMKTKNYTRNNIRRINEWQE